jgi:hypothetical protein
MHKRLDKKTIKQYAVLRYGGYMRCLIIVLTLLFAISSFNIHSQCLESGDIDIFINGYEELRYLHEYLINDELTAVNYKKYLMDANDLLMFFYRLIIADDASPEELENNIIIYQNFLNDGEIGKEVEEMYIKTGWENNGHKKFWTIYYGVFCIAMANVIKPYYTEEGDLVIPADLYLKITEFINNEDMEIINNRIGDMIKTVYK